MSLDPLYVLLGEVSIQVLCPFFNWVVFLDWSSVSSLYVSKIKSLSEVLFTSIFSHTVGSFFILRMFSLAVQKVFVLLFFLSTHISSFIYQRYILSSYRYLWTIHISFILYILKLFPRSDCLLYFYYILFIQYFKIFLMCIFLPFLYYFFQDLVN